MRTQPKNSTKPLKRLAGLLISMACVATFVAFWQKENVGSGRHSPHFSENNVRSVHPQLGSGISSAREMEGSHVSRADRELVHSTERLTSDDSLILREPGDTVKFSGYTIVKIDPKNDGDNPEMSMLQDRWTRESTQFLSEKIGLTQSEIERYAKASSDAFAEYDRKTMALLESAKKIYGPDIALILDGQLQIDYDTSWKSYDRALHGILGDRGFVEFEDFKERFHSIAFDRVGFVPSFVR